MLACYPEREVFGNMSQRMLNDNQQDTSKKTKSIKKV